MANLTGNASAQTTAKANLSSQTLTGFAKQFAAFDAEIMDELGDELKLTAPGGAVLNPKCVLSSYPGIANDNLILSDNIQAKIDIYTVLIEVLAVDVPGLSKGWTARYNDKDYVITDFHEKGDGTLMLILNQPGNTSAVPSGWK